MERIVLTENQKAIITRLGDAAYTPEYLEEQVNRTDNVYMNPTAALGAMGANGYYRAVLAMERMELGTKTGSVAGDSAAAPATPPKKRTPKKVEVKENENSGI